MRIFVKERSFYSKLLSIAIPTSLQSLITFTVNIADTVMVGSLGEYSIAGVALANQFSFLYQITCFGIAGGMGVLTAQFWGKEDRDAMGAGLSIILKIAMAIGLLFMAVAAFFPSAIMSVYTTDPAVMIEGASYLRWLSVSYLFVGLTTMMSSILRTAGVVKLTLLTNCVALFLNISCNWILIFGNLGAPRMGTAGAALATTICRVVEFAIIAVFLFKIDDKIRFRLHMLLRWDKDIFRNYLKNGVPVIVSDVLLAVGNNMTSIVLGRMGAVVTSASSIANTINQLTSVFLMGVANAAGIITGNTVGAGRYKQAKEYGKTFLALTVGVSIFSVCLILLIRSVIFRPFNIGGNIVKIFNVGEDTEKLAGQIIYTLAGMSVFLTLSNILTKGILRSGGDTKFLMLADVVFLWLVSIPLGFLTGLYLKWTPYIVYFFLRIDEVIKCVWCLFRFNSGKWIRNVAVRGEDLDNITAVKE